MDLLTAPGNFRHRVSSVLNGLAEYAGKNMFSDDVTTCWNSDQGTPQYVLIEFNKFVTVKCINITFQGGFVGQDSIFEVGDRLDSMHIVAEVDDFDDSNDVKQVHISNGTPCRYLRIIFRKSTDFFGRITIYNLKILGMHYVAP